jgi:ABC-type Na+ efflux pump permease subunit
VTPHWRLVMAKELGDLLGRMGRRPLTRTLGVVAVFGVLVPLRFPDFAHLPAAFAVFMAFLPARLVAIDAFAGERERGTLEALLTSPLSDRGIVAGKLAAATAYGAVRGWLFVAMWVGAGLGLRATGLAGPPLPDGQVIAATLLAAVIVAYAAAVFGVWQSARAPSVRAILESGGVVRLIVIVTLFFVLPWLLGLLDPAGEAPRLGLPGSEGAVSLAGVRDALAADPRRALAWAAASAAVGALALWRLTVATVRRSRREQLALVETAAMPPRRGFRGPARQGTTPATGPVATVRADEGG